MLKLKKPQVYIAMGVFVVPMVVLLFHVVPETVRYTAKNMTQAKATAVQQELQQHSNLDALNSFVLASQKLSWTRFIQLRERRIFSQNNEDGVLEYIFDNIGTTNKFYVEFGVEGAIECNTRYLYERYGWDGLLLDGSGRTPAGDKRVIRNHFITAEVIVELFQKYDVPKDLDLLSVDIDRNDYYVMREILQAGYRPRVVIAEYNRNFGPKDAFVVPYKKDERWRGDSHFGSSALAWVYLLDHFDYSSVYLDTNGVNQFFLYRPSMIEWLTAQGVTGVSEAMLKDMMPTFTEQYRRTHVIHTRNWDTFMSEQLMPKEWLRVAPDLTLVTAPQEEKEAVRTA